MSFDLVCQLSSRMLWLHACMLLQHNVHQVLVYKPFDGQIQLHVL